ncbi:hypothetical protein BaRGS_00039441 [Batillaria attramentaria]|uniref:Uncharacterized protein n=1 Tax=Batillaria attramentaria TaxID=370345 RepID=A0ABD0J302_9CAEN
MVRGYVNTKLLIHAGHEQREPTACQLLVRNTAWPEVGGGGVGWLPAAAVTRYMLIVPAITLPPGALAPLEHVHIGAMEQDKALAASRREDSGQEPIRIHTIPVCSPASRQM